MGEFSMSHWLLIAIILLLFFGPSKLPQLGKSLGKAINGFKEGLNGKDESENVNGPNERLANHAKSDEMNKEKTKTSEHS